jgi:hypothetical protein
VSSVGAQVAEQRHQRPHEPRSREGFPDRCLTDRITAFATSC